MVSITGLSKSFGSRVLFENLSFHVNPGSCVGLVGANGSGKSTLMRILTGEEEQSSGLVSIPKNTQIGFLKQDQFLNDQEIIIHCVMRGQKSIYEALIRHDPELPTEAYALESHSAAILEGLGIPSAVHGQPLSVLSGGFKLRILLGQVLVSKPELLLLDEPTNHLDIITIRWLEKFLSEYEGAILVISHDRRFLDRICTHILDIDYNTGTLYTGNYSAFELAKQQIEEQKKAEIQNQQAEIAHKQAFIDRFRAQATKARQAQSRIKQLEKIEKVEWIESSRQFPHFEFIQNRFSGREVLKIEGLEKSFGNKQVLRNIRAHLRRGDKTAIIGPNGVGKSTLLKILMGQLQADAGFFEWGYEAQVGYFAQDHESELRKRQKTAETWLWEFCPEHPLGYVKSYLGRVLFTGDEGEKQLQALSGGELARLDLARLMIQKPNVLILDEPTNHLDMESIETLIQALQRYEGTLLFVSHDRWFVSQLAKRIFEIKSQGVNDFLGTFEEYLDKCGDDHLDAKKEPKPKKKQIIEKIKPVNNNRKIEKLATEIDLLEAQKQEIEALFCDPQFFEKNSIENQKKLQDKQKKISQELEKCFTQWEELENS